MRTRYGFVNIIESFPYVLKRHATFFRRGTQNMSFYQIVKRQQLIFLVCQSDERFERSMDASRCYVILALDPCMKRGYRNPHVKSRLRNAVAWKFPHVSMSSKWMFSWQG